MRPAVGTDVALLNGLARVIINEKKLDVEFVTRMTDNFAGWSKSLEAFTPGRVEEITGVPRKDIQLAARMLAGVEQVSIVYGNGITQQANGTDAVIAIANLAMLIGNASRHGGIFALQRENNAQGACDMGALPDFLPGYQSVDDAQNRKKYSERWGRPLPAHAGLTALEMMEQAVKGKVKAMFIVGENPAASFAQPARIKKALSSLDFLVVSDMFLTETARLASVVLPAAGFAEKEGTFTNFEGRIQRVRKAIEPAGDSLPDAEIIRRLAGIMNSPMPYTSPQQVMEEIKEMVPFYHQFNYADADRKDPDLSEAGGNTPGMRRLYKGIFPSGFGRFFPVEYIPPKDIAADGYPLTLMVGSSRYHFGAGSRSWRSARLNRFSGEAFLEISPADAKDRGLVDGDKVKIVSPQGELLTSARVSDTLPRGLLYMPISFPGSPVYELFNNVIDQPNQAPALKSCAVKLERIAENG
jgi:predicted molibdopterin-dependent oxidoreductase YjgC